MKKYKIKYLKSILLLIGILSMTCTKKMKDSKNIAEQQNKEIFSNTENEKDSQFLVNAADMILYQIQLSKLAGQNSIKPDIQKTAREFEDIHTKQLYEIQNIAAKKGMAIPNLITEKEEANYKKMSYEIAEDFEKLYFDEIVKKYKEAIPKFEAAANSKDEDIRLWSIKTCSALRTNLEIALVYQASSHRGKALKIK